MFSALILCCFALQVGTFIVLRKKQRAALAAIYLATLGIAWLVALGSVSAHLPFAAHVVWIVPAIWLVATMCMTARASGPPSKVNDLFR